jgi:small basic protein
MQSLRETVIDRSFAGILKPVYIATGLTLFAELVYFVGWGLILFPEGSLVGKIVWTLTCGLAMGIVIGVATLLVVPQNGSFALKIFLAAIIMALIGSYCAFICSRIDMNYNFFGGAENPILFVVSGVVPALFGGFLYGWILYRSDT